MTVDPARKAEPLRSFGRRKGRPLSPKQAALMAELLPRLQLDLSSPPPAVLTELFNDTDGGPLARPVTQVALEIGFGGSEHLIAQARKNPDTGFVGCEPFEDGVAKAVTAIDEHNLRNVRLWPDDARKIFDWAPAQSFSAAYILFPDPWPKARHLKRRLINADFLVDLSKKLQPGAPLRVATDIGDYLRTTLISVHQSECFEWRASRPTDWRTRPDDWPPTRYEAKALREGRRCYYLTFHRR
ncbi:MAG: tRNA (guanosine(46)-N7)-methyltransferase TrmB [Pseudomonadota bacterium]